MLGPTTRCQFAKMLEEIDKMLVHGQSIEDWPYLDFVGNFMHDVVRHLELSHQPSYMHVTAVKMHNHFPDDTIKSRCEINE